MIFMVFRYTEPLHYLETRSGASSLYDFKPSLNALSLYILLIIYDMHHNNCFLPHLTSLLLLLPLPLLLLILLPFLLSNFSFPFWFLFLCPSLAAHSL